MNANKNILATLPNGRMRYTLTNDYMFRAVFQKNQNALKGLLSALLNIPKAEIKEITILNPIILGETIDEKTCILDIHLRLNNDKLINIEMQVKDFGNWPERSITYLGRTFDQTRSGGNYSDISTTMHIGIVDFNLPHLTPEFYSEYKLMNVKNHEIYSDKFVLRMLNLKSLEDDSIEKKPADLYYWAKLFKATTWEELKMLASKNSDMEDTIVTLHELSADEKIKMQCEARERYQWDMTSAIAKGHERGRREGHVEGLAEGRAEGRAEGDWIRLIKQVCKKLQKGKSITVIADELEEEEATIRCVVDVAAQYAPVYDMEKICRELLSK